MRSYMLLAGVTTAALAFSIAAINCGDGDESTTSTASSKSTSSSTGTGGGGTAGGNPGGSGPGVHAEPPAAPTNGVPPDGTGDSVFAIKKLYLGDTDRDGTPNKLNGWKNYGFDLDNKISTKTSTDLCKPRDNASVAIVYPDGTNGIDNAFGKGILPTILGLSATAASSVNESITGGKFTIMLALSQLGSGANYTGMTAQLYGGGDLMATPKFDGTDKWPVLPDLLVSSTDITQGSKVKFTGSYVNDNTWVSGSKGTVSLSLTVQGYALTLDINSAIISFTMSSDHKTVTNGTIAGVLNTDALLAEIKKVAGGIDKSLCSGSVIDGILKQLEQASDIMADGTQDPTKTCDGISVGLGFDAAPVQLGSIAPASTGTGDACGDAGAN